MEILNVAGDNYEIRRTENIVGYNVKFLNFNKDSTILAIPLSYGLEKLTNKAKDLGLEITKSLPDNLIFIIVKHRRDKDIINLLNDDILGD